MELVPEIGDDRPMTVHSILEAANALPVLIDRALNGESVVIAREGQPVVELRPVPQRPRALTPADIDWIDAHRVGKVQAVTDAAAEVRRMRDEGF